MKQPLIYWLVWLLLTFISVAIYQRFWLTGSARQRRQLARREVTSVHKLRRLERGKRPVMGAGKYLSNLFLAKLVLRVGNSLHRQHWQHWSTVRSSFACTTTETMPLPAKEERFLTRLREQILLHLDQEPLDVNWLAAQANMSRTQLHRKLTALTMLTPNRFIHRVRVEKAAELIQTGKLNVAQAAYEVGYSSPSHFTRIFQEHFGHLPAQLKV